MFNNAGCLSISFEYCLPQFWMQTLLWHRQIEHWTTQYRRYAICSIHKNIETLVTVDLMLQESNPQTSHFESSTRTTQFGKYIATSTKITTTKTQHAGSTEPQSETSFASITKPKYRIFRSQERQLPISLEMPVASAVLTAAAPPPPSSGSWTSVKDNMHADVSILM